MLLGIWGRWRQATRGMWLAAWLCVCGLAWGPAAHAGFSVYVSGNAGFAAPAALPNLVSLNMDALGSPVSVTGAGIASSDQAHAGGGSTTNASVSAGAPPSFSGKYFSMSSGTSGWSGSVFTVNFAGGGTNYVSFMWNLAFADSGNEYLNVRYTLSNGSTTITEDVGNCPSKTSVDCIPSYSTGSSWLFTLVTDILAGIFDCGGPDDTGTVRLSYTPPAGYKVTKMEATTVPNGAGFLCLFKRNNYIKIDQLSYVNGSIGPHHMEVSATATSVAAAAPVVLGIKACADALSPCTPYTLGVSGSVAVTGVTADYSVSGQAFSIAPGSSSTSETVKLSGGTATLGLSGVTPAATASPGVYCGLAGSTPSSEGCALIVVPPLDHFEITTSVSTGLTCAPTTFQIKACAEASRPCGSTYPLGVSGGSLVLTGTGGSSVPAVIDGTGVVSKAVQITKAGSVTVGLSGMSPAAVSSPAVYCGWNGAALSAGAGACAFTTNSSALLVTVPAHVSNVATAIAVQAVKSNADQSACVPAFTGDKSINLSCRYSNPNTGSKALSVGASTLACGAGVDGTSVPTTLNFDGSGVARPTLTYADVGQLRLTGSYSGTAGVDADTTGFGEFVVKPASFAISDITPVPITAGGAFSATITARNSTGQTTPNFGKESGTTADYVRLSFAKASPVAGQAGVFTGTGTSSSPSLSSALFGAGHGVATVSNLSWTEVGTGDLSAALAGTYLGEASTASGSTGSAGGVGPFVPAYFDVSAGAHALSCSGLFTYSGQPFNVVVTARNLAGNITRNYASQVDLFPVETSLGSMASAVIDGGSFSNGVSADVAATATSPSFTFASKTTAPSTVHIRAKDHSYPVVSSEGHGEPAIPIRSGMLKVSNFFGSAKTSLNLPVQALYWNGKAWMLNTQDSCTSIPATAVVPARYLDHKGASPTTPDTTWATTPSAVSIVGGRGQLSLSPPPSGATGSVDLALNLGSGGADNSCLASHPTSTGAGLSWLRGVNGATSACTGSHDPSARATFGVYEAESKKLIQMRDIF